MRNQLAVACACALAGLGASLSLAATASHGPVTVDIQDDSENCGIPPGYDVNGTTKFTRAANRLMVNVKLTAGDPSTAYTEVLYDADTCAAIATLGGFSTNASGIGGAKFRAQVHGHSSFFVDSFDGNDSNDSAIATLPRPGR